MILNAHRVPLCDSCIGVFKSLYIFMFCEVKNCWYIYGRPKRFVTRAWVGEREKKTTKSDMASIKKVKLTIFFSFKYDYKIIFIFL